MDSNAAELIVLYNTTYFRDYYSQGHPNIVSHIHIEPIQNNMVTGILGL